MEDFIKELSGGVTQILSGIKEEFSGIRTNRPSSSLIENIRVEYAGESLTIKQLGSISVLPPRELAITLWDQSVVTTVAKAIETSTLHLSPSVDGTTIRVQLPSLTDERKQEMVKLVKAVAEKYRIRIRSDRDLMNKKIANASDEKQINEDQKFKLKKQVQEAVDKANGDIEGLVTNKVKEINE